MPGELRRCRVCNEEKPITEFRKAEHGNRAKNCKACAAANLRKWREQNKEHVAQYTRKYQSRPEYLARHREYNRKRHYDMTVRERHRDNYLRRTFGITLDEYNQMLAEQDGRCAICRATCKSGRQLAVDHCHETGVVRGLLCMNCNRVLGWMDDDADRLMAAAAYVLQTRDVLKEAQFSMGYTEKISDYELDRAWTTGPVAEGYDVEAEAVKSETRSKKVEGEDGDEPKKSTARTKAK